MSIKCIKLITGEELIADVTVPDGQNSVNIKSPFALSMMRDPKDPKAELQLALFPYAPYVFNHTIMVDPSKVIWAADIPETMIIDYNNALVRLESTRQSMSTKS